MEAINCIFCDKPNDRVVIEENGYTGIQCSRCGLIYISPRPALGEMVRLYGLDSASVRASSHISAEFTSRLIARHHLRILTSHVTRGALLEIGAGAGYFLDEARKLGFEPYATELNPLQAEFICNTLHIPCAESPSPDALFGDRRFDVVYHCDVISHFYDPIGEFRKLNQKLNEGGWMVFETGNCGEVRPKYLRLLERFQYPDHLFFFTTDNLRDLLQRTGFELVQIRRYSIVAQLWATRLTRRLARAVKRRAWAANGAGNKTPGEPRNGADRSRGASASSSPAGPSVWNLLRLGWSYFNYLLRYKLGRIAPKAHRPQTVIVIARKTGPR